MSVWLRAHSSGEGERGRRAGRERERGRRRRSRKGQLGDVRLGGGGRCQERAACSGTTRVLCVSLTLLSVPPSFLPSLRVRCPRAVRRHVCLLCASCPGLARRDPQYAASAAASLCDVFVLRRGLQPTCGGRVVMVCVLHLRVGAMHAGGACCSYACGCCLG